MRCWTVVIQDNWWTSRAYVDHERRFILSAYKNVLGFVKLRLAKGNAQNRVALRLSQ